MTSKITATPLIYSFITTLHFTDGKASFRVNNAMHIIGASLVGGYAAMGVGKTNGNTEFGVEIASGYTGPFQVQFYYVQTYKTDSTLTVTEV